MESMGLRVEINKDRIKYLLALYKMSEEDLLSLLNEGRKRLVDIGQISGGEMDVALLKRIDKIFDKGLDFYQDFSPLRQTASSSVFFRKDRFGTELNMESIRTVSRFENLKQALDAYNKLSKMSIATDLGHCSVQDAPREVAMRVREALHPGENIKDARAFLVGLIAKCAERGVFVFEYVEPWNKKEKTNIDGFYLHPNMIVLKRHKHYKREIFTLAHELGHCLLDVEEVEPVDVGNVEPGDVLAVSEADVDYGNGGVERWCNDFAYYFIMGGHADELERYDMRALDNDIHDYITELSGRTHLSRLALYTRLYIDRRMTYREYADARNELAEAYRMRLEQEKRKNEGKKRGATPRPIISPLFLRSMQYAYFKGVVDEGTFCSRLNAKPAEFEKMLWK